MGEKKTDFGSSVTELDVFRQGKKAKIYGPGMTKAQELDGAERVLAISPGQIEEMVAAAIESTVITSMAELGETRYAAFPAFWRGTQLVEKALPQGVPPSADGGIK